ncbi:outer membrane beta-barrel protein [Mucilaginibacter psychrotolerans]|nr:outer membrane beta-barrel protein [Mucilaginibacter psychrotolerans]
MKILTTIIAVILLTFAAKAQTTRAAKAQFSIGIDAGIATAGIKETNSVMLGVSLQAGIPIAKELQFTIGTGFQNYFGKSLALNLQDAPSSYKTPSVQIVPLKAGLKYFLEPNFYIQGEAGAAFLLNKSAFSGDKSVAFTYAPQIGVLCPVNTNGNFIDIGIRYEATRKFNADYENSRVSLVGLRVAYGF